MEDQNLDKKKNNPVKVLTNKWIVWYKFELKGSKACGEIIYYLTKTYKIDVDLLSCADAILINTIFPSSKKGLV